ncbi:hypothetical protein SAMN04487996_110292 [Dyadobacter soli]|uniref:Uncharacterized protein n=1 Tax=Dyadobacter soli TaxID=659014 RepID=A0A1G7L1V0_9BACT|nr:hypothetical protein [Dyadobacter soli]SDF43522.1 hypothetical protein SAMN04487996_110292 [Dyadobacter soli]
MNSYTGNMRGADGDQQCGYGDALGEVEKVMFSGRSGYQMFSASYGFGSAGFEAAAIFVRFPAIFRVSINQKSTTGVWKEAITGQKERGRGW